MGFITPSSGLGRRVPTDFEHITKYPMRAVLPRSVATVERTLELPWWHKTHDQGEEGACEGFGNTMMAAILNLRQRKLAHVKPNTVRYDPWWLWDRAKEIDEWPDTNPGDSQGTSGRAACEVMRTQGLIQYKFTRRLLPHNGYAGVPDTAHGIDAYRWATSVDEMRTALASYLPMAIGVNWYSNFDEPRQKGREWWIGNGELGSIRGGHCVCVYGASDRKQAFKIKNSWGAAYPEVWMPYETMQRLIGEYGEVALVTDR